VAASSLLLCESFVSHSFCRFVEQLDAIVSPAFLLCTSFDLPCDIYPHVLACSRTSLQKALFSATVPQKTLEIVDSIMDNAVHITIGARLATASNIDQKLVYCGNEEGKLVAIRTLLQTSCRPPVLIFVQSKERAQELYCPSVPRFVCWRK